MDINRLVDLHIIKKYDAMCLLARFIFRNSEKYSKNNLYATGLNSPVFLGLLLCTICDRVSH